LQVTGTWRAGGTDRRVAGWIGPPYGVGAVPHPPRSAVMTQTSTGGIQNELFQSSYATMTQTNDYSFNSADTSFTADPAITVYDNGTLIYGTEP
jgi:hypothetical protein